MKVFSALKKLGRLSNPERWCAGAVFMVTYLAYLLTLYPTVASEDAGEFSTAVSTLGISHPAGYPLYILLGKVFTLFIPFGGMAWKVNLFSAFCAAAASAIFYLCLKLFTRNDYWSVCGALVFAVGGIFWSQSVRAEVYALNAVFFLLILFLLFLWHEKKSEFTHGESKIFLLFTAFLYGLSLGNHYLMFLAGIPFLFFVILSVPHFFKDWKFLLKALGFFCLGLAVYLYLPIRASMHPVLNWGNPSSWENFWNHILRKFYSSDAVDASMNLHPEQQHGLELFSGWWFDDVTRYHIWQMFLYVLQHFAEDYFWGLLLFVPAGLWSLWKRSKPYAWLLLLLFIFYSFVLSKLLGLGYAGRLPVDLFKDRPFYIPVLLILCFLSVIGLADVSRKFVKGSLRKLPVILLGFLLVYSFVTHFPQQNQSRNYVAHDLAMLALDILPRDAVYFIQNSDNTFFPVLYLNTVEGVRPDVKFYIQSPIDVYNFFTTFENLVQENPGRRIFTDFPFTDYVGMAYDYFGPVSEIVQDQHLSRQKSILPLLEKFNVRGLQADNLDHFNTYLKGRLLLDTALAYGGIDDGRQGELFNLSVLSAPDSVNIFSQLIGNYYVRKSMFAQALPFLNTAYEYYPDEYSIQFELFLSNVLTGNSKAAFPYFSALLDSRKDLFLNEYDQVKQMFPNNAAEFQSFERLVQASHS